MSESKRFYAEVQYETPDVGVRRMWLFSENEFTEETARGLIAKKHPNWIVRGVRLNVSEKEVRGAE